MSVFKVKNYLVLHILKSQWALKYFYADGYIIIIINVKMNLQNVLSYHNGI